MGWLGQCAKVVAKQGSAVSWTTPLGLPVIQPYRSTRSRTVVTVLQKVTIAESNDDLPVKITKQRTAFPPNFVHSIDSTHMMLTALACHEQVSCVCSSTF